MAIATEFAELQALTRDELVALYDSNLDCPARTPGRYMVGSKNSISSRRGLRLLVAVLQIRSRSKPKYS